MTMQHGTTPHFITAPLRRSGSATTLRLRRLMEEQQKIEIGGRIRELREASHHTNRSIAEHVGVGERSVANWVSGSTGIEWENAKKVAELFGRDPMWLWAGEGGTPDLMQSLNGDSPALRAQLDRIEEKLDEVLRRLPPAEDADAQDQGPEAPLPGSEDADEDHEQQHQARGQKRTRRRGR